MCIGASSLINDTCVHVCGVSLCAVGIGLVRIPTFSKTPLDLFKVYSSVQNLGGFVNVSTCTCRSLSVLVCCARCK